MNQNLWGPKFWFTLHTITFEYPLNPSNKDKEVYYCLFNNLQYMLPCSVCRKNYTNNLKELPLINNLNSRRDLVYWLIDIHNKVNTETGKRIYNYDEVINNYQKLLNKKIILGNSKNKKLNYNNNYKYITIVLSILLAITLLVFIRKISKIF